MKNYYQILEISREANLAEIKSSFRRLAKRYHPDISKSSDTAAKFIAITEAYHILIDPKKRNEYDALWQKHVGGHFPLDDRDVAAAHARHEQWARQAREQAREQAEMSYSDYAKLILGEVRFAIRFTVEAFLIALGAFWILGFLSMIPKAVADSSAPDGMVAILIFGILLVGYFMWVLIEKIKEGYDNREN